MLAEIEATASFEDLRDIPSPCAVLEEIVDRLRALRDGLPTR